MSKEKVTAKERARAAKDCAEGHMSQSETVRHLGVRRTSVHEWVQRYKANGEEAFRVF